MRDCGPIIEVVEKRKNVSSMIGVNVDEPYLSQITMRAWEWTRSFGFADYVVWAPKRFDPFLRMAFVRAVSHARLERWLEGRSWWRKGSSRRSHAHETEVGAIGMFTDLVLEVLSQSLREDHPLRDRDAGLERGVTRKKFRSLKQPVWIEPDQAREASEENLRGIAILPINVWGSGQKHSLSGSEEELDVCVNHVLVRKPKPKREWHDRLFA